LELASEIKTLETTEDGSFYLGFARNNNATAEYESLYTNSNITFNPDLQTFSVPNIIATNIKTAGLYAENDHIVLRNGAESQLDVGQHAGLIVKIPDGLDDAALVFDRNGTARIGDISYDGGVINYSGTQAIATREDTPTDKAFSRWDSTSKQFKTDVSLYGDAVNDRIGIGTTSPTEKLDVVGNVKITNNNVAETPLTVSAINGITSNLQE
jgi:hypothetical protein